jgi:hypothetical protein
MHIACLDVRPLAADENADRSEESTVYYKVETDALLPELVRVLLRCHHPCI